MTPESFKMENQWPDGVIVGRHTIRPDVVQPESSRYPGTTETIGVEAVREKMSDIFTMVESADKDALVIIIGASEEPRVQATAEIIGDLLEEKYRNNPDKIIVTRSQVQQMREDTEKKNPANFKILHHLSNLIADNRNTQVIIDDPLFVKQFSLRPYFRHPETATHTEFAKHIMDTARAEHGDPTRYDEAGAIDPLASYQAESTGGAKAFMSMEKQEDVEPYGGVTPQHIAEEHVRALQRLTSFVKKQLRPEDRERQLIIGMIGHGWNVDAFFSYLANQGEANLEGYMQATDNGEAVRMPEMAQMKIGRQGEPSTFSFRGRDFEIPEEFLNIPKEK